MDTADIPPCQTIYAQNLNEKINVEELKKSLYHVFSQFGNILEIHANKRFKMRGQAWIVFDGLQGATKALREMQGFMFYGKPMKVAFAKSKSDTVAKLDGTFKPRPKRKVDGAPEPVVKKPKAPTKPKEDEAKMVVEPVEAAPAPAPVEEQAPPNKILFLENLPPQCNTAMLKMLFIQYEGYVESRMVPGKPGIAFVEFKDQFQSGTAKDALQNFKMTETHQMKITFAKQ